MTERSDATHLRVPNSRKASRPRWRTGGTGRVTNNVGGRPATYRTLFGVREYRYLFAANVLSRLGDQVAKVALTVLVYARTGSAALAAVAFAAAHVPWIVGGPLLSTYADRLPRRRVLIRCDLVRAVIVATMFIPDLPSGVLIGQLFVATIFSPPFASARAAMLPDVLDGDVYVLGSALDGITLQITQVAGFGAGGAAVVLLTPRGALMADAVTFALSGVLIAIGVRERPAAAKASSESRVLHGFAVGASAVFRNPVLRMYVLLFWSGSACVYAAEGLALPLAAQYGGGASMSGLLLAAAPCGTVVGSLVVTRMIAPRIRTILVVPLAFWSCLILVPSWVAPDLWIVVALLCLAGAAGAYAAVLNAEFARAVPSEVRGRAFGLANAGVQTFQASAAMLAGLAAEEYAPTSVIATSGLFGALTIVLLAISDRKARGAAVSSNESVGYA